MACCPEAEHSGWYVLDLRVKMKCFRSSSQRPQLAKRRFLRGTCVGGRGLAVRSGLALKSFVLYTFGCGSYLHLNLSSS